LSNIKTPLEVEDTIEGLRQQPPVVTWTVRCYHYTSDAGGASSTASSSSSSSKRYRLPLLKKKIQTHSAKKKYTYASWSDNTEVGVWERAPSLSPQSTPLTKLSLCKKIVFKDEKARLDYFSQQAAFVTLEGQRDDCAEFSTRIDVPGFKSKMLAKRTVLGARGTGLFKLWIFWLATVIGFSVPYRSWFGAQCDNLCVQVVKETTAVAMSSGNGAAGGSADGSPAGYASGYATDLWQSSSDWYSSFFSSSSVKDEEEAAAAAVTKKEKKKQDSFREAMKLNALYECDEHDVHHHDAATTD
jgi:hypothetical protein